MNLSRNWTTFDKKSILSDIERFKRVKNFSTYTHGKVFSVTRFVLQDFVLKIDVYVDATTTRAHERKKKTKTFFAF